MSLKIKVAGRFVDASKMPAACKAASLIQLNDPKSGTIIEASRRTIKGRKKVMNKLALKVRMLAASVVRMTLEAYKPNMAKVTAATRINNCEINSSLKETPPNRKAMLCNGIEAKMSKKT